jgi:hypothetical protein
MITNNFLAILESLRGAFGGFDLALQERLRLRHPGVSQVFVESQHPLDKFDYFIVTGCVYRIGKIKSSCPIMNSGDRLKFT